MTDPTEEQARAKVREAVLASVALVARDVNEVDVAPSVLIEGADAAIVAQVLASMVSTLLTVTLGEDSRQLLVRVSRRAVEDFG